MKNDRMPITLYKYACDRIAGRQSFDFFSLTKIETNPENSSMMKFITFVAICALVVVGKL